VRAPVCSDHKVVAVFGGFGGSGCNKPCFLCTWDRNDPCGNTIQRRAAETLKKSERAEKYLKPIHDSAAAVKVAQNKLAEAKKQKRPRAEVIAAAKCEEHTARKKTGCRSLRCWQDADRRSAPRAGSSSQSCIIAATAIKLFTLGAFEAHRPSMAFEIAHHHEWHGIHFVRG
jgi:hypothetical protein